MMELIEELTLRLYKCVVCGKEAVNVAICPECESEVISIRWD